MKSQQLTKDLEMLLNEVNEILNFKFNGILVNEYLDGNDYISAHSDDEKGLDEVVGVILLSYGVERIFRIRDKKTKKKLIDVLTTHDYLFQMCGDFQKHYTHEIPSQKKIKDSRISFTFRKHLT